MDMNTPPTASASELTSELARPSLVGVRSAWTWRPLAAMTPAQVADVLRRAAQGDAHDFLLAAADIEEKDLHYRAVLQTRKLAVCGLALVVSPGDDSAPASAAAELVREQFAKIDVPSLALALLDALSRGYAVAELVWQTGGRRWWIDKLLPREPTWFVWDRASGRELRLHDGSAEGALLPKYKFVVHAPLAQTSAPALTGLARSALWAWVFKSYALRDWAAFCELYGQPIRLGKYDASASPEDVATLKRAVMDVGSDAAAVLPQSMVLEIVESAGKTASAELYASLIRYLDEQVSKAVLGQTLTTDAGRSGSLAQARVHDGVRDDLLRFDARALAATLRHQVAEPLVRLNLGPDAPVPLVELHIEEGEDLDALGQQLIALAQVGLDVPLRWVREKWGIPKAEASEAVLVRTQPAAGVSGHRSGLPTALHALIATNPAAESTSADPTAALQQQLSSAGAPAWHALLGQIQALVEQADSLGALQDALLGAYGDLDSAELVKIMASALALAELKGLAEVPAQSAGS